MFDIDFNPNQYADDQSQALIDKRRNAWRFLKENGFPTRKNEQWKYTDLKALFTTNNLSLQPATGKCVLSESVLAQIKPGEAYALIFVDGCFDAQNSDLKQLESGVQVKNILESKYASKASDYDQAPALSLNDALFSAGVEINVASETELSKPIALVHVSSGNAAYASVCYQNVINMKAYAKAQIIEKYVSLDFNEPSLTDMHAKLYLQEGAKLNWRRLTESAHANMFIKRRIDADIAGFADFRYFGIDAHGVLNRSDFEIHLNEPEASSTLDGIFITSNKMHCDHQVVMAHHASHTNSDVYFRGVATDQSTGIFNVKALVHPGLEKVTALQSNKNLQLKKTATINTKPELEIHSDDVVCSHGATIGQLDQEVLHYLLTRGIDRKMAIEMMTQGFVAEVLERPNLSDSLFDQLKDQLNDTIRDVIN
jgi:Fe-S cluster assembly protein SufD